jgi:hypothetical protein
MDINNFLTLFISLLALLVTYVIFKTNQSPRIIVYATPHYGKQTFIQLNIKNIGSGIAENVTLKGDQTIPRSAFGITKLNEPRKTFDGGVFKYGIKIFHPNQSYIFDWGQFGGLKEALNNKPITFYITYHYKHPLNIWKSKITDISIIDIRELEALPANVGNLEDKLDKIHKELQNMNRISKSKN